MVLVGGRCKYLWTGKLLLPLRFRAQVVVEDPHSALRLLAGAARRRAVSRTAMNATSSRGHAVFQLALDGGAKLCVVDLAGRENERTTQCSGQALAELGFINKTLFHLTNVIQVLASPRSTSRVPYRNSKLTMLLSEYLQSARTFLVATVGPAASGLEETVATLRTAKAVSRVTTRRRRSMSRTCTPRQEAFDELSQCVRARSGSPQPQFGTSSLPQPSCADSPRQSKPPPANAHSWLSPMAAAGAAGAWPSSPVRPPAPRPAFSFGEDGAMSSSVNSFTSQSGGRGWTPSLGGDVAFAERLLEVSKDMSRDHEAGPREAALAEVAPMPSNIPLPFTSKSSSPVTPHKGFETSTASTASPSGLGSRASTDAFGPGDSPLSSRMGSARLGSARLVSETVPENEAIGRFGRSPSAPSFVTRVQVRCYEAWKSPGGGSKASTDFGESDRCSEEPSTARTDVDVAGSSRPSLRSTWAPRLNWQSTA